MFIRRILRVLPPSSVHTIAIAFGGGLGALVRFFAEMIIANGIVSVLVCNIAGTFVLASTVQLRERIHPDLGDLISFGFCGGLSVFATFSKNSVFEMMQGEYLVFMLNVIGNFTLCLLAVWLADYIAEKSPARKFFHPTLLQKLMGKLQSLKNKIFRRRL